MEEMMRIRSQETSSTHILNPNFPIKTSSSCPTWKLYENPFYISQQSQEQTSTDKKQIHRLHLPISARKIAASFWDLTFIKPFMESELEIAKAQINELKAELECERKERKKTEHLNKRLAKEISSGKDEIMRLKKGTVDKRKMLRVAEVIREERVQIKLAEAKFLLEGKLAELEVAKKMGSEQSLSSSSDGKQETHVHKMEVTQKRSSPEAENPHIKRGIKGFVEFPKVVRGIGCRSSKHLSSKLECQNGQLEILVKQEGACEIDGVIAR